MSNEASFLVSFGEALKWARKRKRLTQKQLAYRLGVHYNTISAWELGTYLPETRGLVLELAQRLGLDQEETRQLLESSLTALAPRWSVPLPRNPSFTGREAMLQNLETRLGAEQIISLTPSYALQGMGGIGKTQIALEYAYRHTLSYAAILWINAETEKQILFSMMRIAEALQLPERKEADQQRIVDAIQHWLATHSKWLLIWDNVEDLDLFRRWFPPAKRGAILLTTRSQALGALAQGMVLPPMEREEGRELVVRRARVPEAVINKSDEIAAIEELVHELGGLPLALDQAGAYVEEIGCSFADYLQRYRQQRARLLARRGMVEGDHPQSVTATFLLASERVERKQRAASDILRVCAFLHAEAIPEELFLIGAAYLGEGLAALAANPEQFDQAIAALRSLSLVQRQVQTRTFSIHRLVQVVLREEMEEQEQIIWMKRIIKALHAAFPKGVNVALAQVDIWEQCERLLPHVLACMSILPEQAGEQEAGEVMREAANYLSVRGRYVEAEVLYEQALRLGKQTLGSEHPGVASTLHGLGAIYLDRGNFEQAEVLYRQALQIGENALGSDHLDIAPALRGLAKVYSNQGKYEQAEQLWRRTLHLQERELGSEHPEIALILSDLSFIFLWQGKDEQAEELYRRALRIQEQALGAEHPQVAFVLSGLAELLSTQEKYEQAKILLERALRIREQTLGSGHFLVAASCGDLAALFTARGKYEQAEILYRRALSILEALFERHFRAQKLGPGHFLVAVSRGDLAIPSIDQKKEEQPEALYQKAFYLLEHAPTLVLPLDGLAELYSHQGKYEQAEMLYLRLLHLRKQTWGAEHPKLATLLNGLAYIYTVQEKEKQAEELYQQALRILERAMGPEHLMMAHPLHSLAELRQRQGNLSEALALTRRVLAIRSQSLGTAHPKTIVAQTCYEQLARSQAF